MIKPGDKVIIAGDSWAVGEWPVIRPVIRKFGNYVIHPGLSLFLENYGCLVTNIGIGGGSNHNSFQALSNQLIIERPDIVFWFQTDPGRDFSALIWNSIKTIDEYTEQRLIHLEIAYQNLNSLNFPVHCLGGLSNLNVDLLTNYKNLYPLIPSIFEMLDAEAPICISPSFANPNMLNELTYEFVEELSMLPDWKKSLPKQWFYPDGRHPNRYAHKKIFEYILNYK
jgi:hypothetical protein